MRGTEVIDGDCQIRDFNLDKVMETSVKVDEMHQLLFVIESFDQPYEAGTQVRSSILKS
jgi:phenylalanine-4-hydroxylase